MEISRAPSFRTSSRSRSSRFRCSRPEAALRHSRIRLTRRLTRLSSSSLNLMIPIRSASGILPGASISPGGAGRSGGILLQCSLCRCRIKRASSSMRPSAGSKKRASMKGMVDMGLLRACGGYRPGVTRLRERNGDGLLFRDKSGLSGKAGAFPVWRVTSGDVPRLAAGQKRIVTGNRSWSGCLDDAQSSKTRQWDRTQVGQARSYRRS